MWNLTHYIVALLAASVTAMSAATAAPNCNTRSGQVGDQPPFPEAILSRAAIPDSVRDSAPTIESQRYDLQTLPIKLESDIDTLRSLDGRYTHGVPVLLVRLENYPDFDPHKHCNRVAVQLVKPRIDRIDGDRYRASYDAGHYFIEFDQKDQANAWQADPQAPSRLFWIFPQFFGRERRTGNYWDLTARYDDAFNRARKGSDEKRWIAEAYINLALRGYRLIDLSRAYPVNHFVDRASAYAELAGRTGIDCNVATDNIMCLASELIERNELGKIDGKHFPETAFISGDALLVNSGISTGIRQLDFASGNEQAMKVGPKLLPMLFANARPGYEWLRPIRQWEVDWLERWYSVVGRSANDRLSEQEAQNLLVSAHVEFIMKAPTILQTVRERYPGWSFPDQLVVALVHIDLENVSGYALYLPKAAANYCGVLTDSSHSDKHRRTNEGMVRSQLKRVANAISVVQRQFPAEELDNCARGPQ